MAGSLQVKFNFKVRVWLTLRRWTGYSQTVSEDITATDNNANPRRVDRMYMSKEKIAEARGAQTVWPFK